MAGHEQVVALAVVAGIAGIGIANAEFHIHGVTVPDWYDPDCCAMRDCHPVEGEDTIEYFTEGGFVYKYTRSSDGVTGLFVRSQVKSSQDGRYHVCHSQNFSWTGNGPEQVPGQHFSAYCIYVPGAA